MGEDIRDALADPGWRCPCCRGICNCSGATCQRKSHGLRTTGQLVLEAKSLGYPSVSADRAGHFATCVTVLALASSLL